VSDGPDRVSYDDTNRLEHRLSGVEFDLEDLFETIADEIHRHASLRTLSTHDAIARWASEIDCATKAVQSAERAIEVRNMHEQPVSGRLQ